MNTIQKLLTDTAIFILNMNAMFLIAIAVFMRMSRFGEDEVGNTQIGFFYIMTTLIIMMPLVGIFMTFEI